jgi:hypothetical protein
MDRLIVGLVALALIVFVGRPDLASEWDSIGVILEGRSVFETGSPLFTYLVAQIASGFDISLLSAAFYSNAVCFAVAVSFMQCWAITQTGNRWSALQLTTLMAITPVISLGSIAVPGHGLALACTALAFWLVSRGSSQTLSTNHAALAGVALLIGVLAHETAIFAPIVVLGWLLTRGRILGFSATVSLFLLPAVYMVLGSAWATEQAMVVTNNNLVASLQTEWVRPFMPLSLVLIYLLFRKGQRLASASVLAMVGALVLVTSEAAGSGMGLAALLWPAAHIAFRGLSLPGRTSVCAISAAVAFLALTPRLPDRVDRSYSDALAQHVGDQAITMLSLGHPDAEMKACAGRRGAKVLSLDSLLDLETKNIVGRAASFDEDVRRRLSQGERVILGVSTAERLLRAARKKSMGAGFVEYITKHYVVHFTVVDGFKLVELTDGSKEASGDTQVFTLDPPPSTP